jgi:restriction system protein
MKKYYRIMLGRKSALAPQCNAGNFIGADFGINQDLTGQLPEAWRDFNHKFIPRYMEANPGKSKVAAGLSCGFLWTVAKGIQRGDIVLCPDGSGSYRVGEVTGEYQYVPGEVLPHRRSVCWLEKTIQRSEMSEALRNSTGSLGTVAQISMYGAEIEELLGHGPRSNGTRSDPEIEDEASFRMEKHLESFLVENWSQTELGKNYEILEEDGELVGQQYQTDTGPIDLLAISKDRKKLLVVELKKGRVSDAVVGQIARYMGYVKEELAEDYQSVEGVIIGLDDDQRVKRALSVFPNVRFYRYQISFKLLPAES